MASSEGAFLSFLPKALAALERLTIVGVDDDTNLSGPEYKTHIIER